MTTLNAIKLVEGSSDPIRFFGDAPAKKYREFARILHPDTTEASGKSKDRAVRAFEKLTELYNKLNSKNSPSPSLKISKWTITESMCKGDIADLHYAVAPDGSKVIFKITRSESDNDLMEAEYVNLGILGKSHGISNFGKYLPRALESLEASGRRANVFSPAEGHPLAQILSLFPAGLDFRHIVWMGNRALNALGFIHKSGVVHGAILPEHLIYGPVSHGLTIIDWCYSITAESKQHIPARVINSKNLYPAEVGRKSPAIPQTDIYMLAATLKSAGKIPKRFIPFFDHCLAASPRSRPEDAWVLADRWTTLAAQEYGPPAYLPLNIPIT
jgi:hypothetical protein